MAPMILSRRTFLHVTAGVASGQPRRGRLAKLTRLGQFEHATKTSSNMRLRDEAAGRDIPARGS